MLISDKWQLWFIRIWSWIRPWSAPRVRAVLEVVVLELDLIFDLVDQNLRQEDANQLAGEEAQTGLISLVSTIKV